MFIVPQISTDHPPSVRYGIRFWEKNVKTCMAPALLCLTYQCGEKTKKKKNQQLTKKLQNVVSAMEEVSRSSQLIAEEGNLLITSGEVT